MTTSPDTGELNLTELTEFGGRWWQWHLGDRMVRHQHPGDTDFGCSWPDCAWHGYRPGDDTFIDSLPGVASQSIAATHLEELRLGGDGHFVYERDADLYEDDDDNLD